MAAASGAGGIDALQTVIALVLSVVLARWLGPHGYGQYSFVIGLVSLLAIIGAFGFPELLVRELASSSVDPSREAPANVFLRSCAISTAMTAAVAALAWLAFEVAWPLDQRGNGHMLALGLALLFTMVWVAVSSSAVRSLGRVILGVFLGSLLPSLLAFVFVVTLIAAGSISPEGALAARLAGFAVASVAAVYLVMRLLRRTDGPTPGAHTTTGYRQLFHASAPFVLIGGANIILARSDLVIIGLLMEPADVALYAIALNAGVLVNFGVRASNMALAPEFARLAVAGELTRLQVLCVRSARLIFLFGLAICLVTIVAGQPLIRLIFGSAYEAAYPALVISALGYAVSTAFGTPGSLLNMTGHQTASLKILVLAALSNIVLNIALIPLLGIIGAAISTAICIVGWKWVAMHVVREKLGIGVAVYHKAGGHS